MAMRKVLLSPGFRRSGRLLGRVRVARRLFRRASRSISDGVGCGGAADDAAASSAAATELVDRLAARGGAKLLLARARASDFAGLILLIGIGRFCTTFAPAFFGVLAPGFPGAFTTGCAYLDLITASPFLGGPILGSTALTFDTGP